MSDETARASRPVAVPADGGQPEPDRGRLYWLWRNGTDRLRTFARRHRGAFVALVLVAAVVLLLLRAAVHPFVIALRVRMFLVVIGLPLLLGVGWLLFSGSFRRRLVTAVVVLPLLSLAVYWGEEVHHYLALYNRFRTLPVVELPALPVTDHERIQPLNSIYSLAHEAISESETPMRPFFVRVGDEYRWTMGIEPAYAFPRTFGSVQQIFSVPGTAASPRFQRDNRIPVHFETGEEMLFGSNSHTAVIRSFGLWRYLNYEPTDVSYIPDDDGQWVQIVSLIRWSGLFFPQPEFGGVQLIRQHHGTALSFVGKMLFGAGEWIPPEDVAKHRFLAGQHVLSYAVSRYMAGSFRFQNGFLAPFPGYHQDDIRIPDMPADVNDQPFTVCFRMPGATESKLFHYFALEPYDPAKQGLNTSLFIPADGSGPVYAYRHHEHAGSLTGVSAISTKVMESRKQYDWNRNRPVEHRPFIRDIDGTVRFFWLTTVVTTKETEGTRHFIAGSAPEVIITDATYNVPVWVDPMHPETWVDELKRVLGTTWRGS
jgi:hypothetical protein